jgi:hypothetical protein
MLPKRRGVALIAPTIIHFLLLSKSLSDQTPFEDTMEDPNPALVLQQQTVQLSQNLESAIQSFNDRTNSTYETATRLEKQFKSYKQRAQEQAQVIA